MIHFRKTSAFAIIQARGSSDGDLATVASTQRTHHASRQQSGSEMPARRVLYVTPCVPVSFVLSCGAFSLKMTPASWARGTTLRR
jgi:hypothetical protein